jgi:hypothetical protein
MSDQKRMDEFLRDSFSDYSPDVPGHIWENIAAEKRKKRPVAFWFSKKKLLVLAICLLAITGTSLLLLQKNNTNHIALEANNNGRKQGAEKSAPAAVVNNDADLSTANDASSLPDNYENVTSQSAAENIDVINQNTTSTITDNKHQKSNLKKTTNALISKDGKVNTDNANDLFRDNKKKKLAKKGSAGITQRVALADDMSFDTNDAVTDADMAGADKMLSISGLAGSKEKIIFSSLANKTIVQTIIKPTGFKVPDCPLAEKDAAGNKSYFEVYISPDYAFKNYSDTAHSVMVEKRKESLSFQSAYSAGIRYTRVFSNGMSIRAGINYSQINEKFSFIKDNVVQLVYVINPQGDTTSSYYVRGTRYSNTYNHYRTIDVPVVIGYELGNGRLHANINAGVILNVQSWQSGQTLDEHYLPVNITTGKTGNAVYQYKTNLGVGFTGGVSVYYKLNDRFHLLAEPYGRFNVSPMNNAAVSLQEKFTTIGLRLGLRMDF